MKTSMFAAVLALAAFGRAYAAEPVVLQLKWVPQAQFAGYYVAQAKGFYKDAGLDVTIKPTGPQHGRVDAIRKVRRGDDDDAVPRHRTVEERQPRVDYR